MRPDDLDTVLDSVRSRIARHRGQSIGEQNTKNVLIEPVLRALGWDVEDLDEVCREFKRKPADNPVDYSIYLMRTPRLFVEAKALGENLNDDKWAKQIMGYASVVGVPWIVLTDGNEWRIYNSHAQVPVEEKLFRQITVSSDDPTVAETLLPPSKTGVQSGDLCGDLSLGFRRSTAPVAVSPEGGHRLVAHSRNWATVRPATVAAPSSSRHPRALADRCGRVP